MKQLDEYRILRFPNGEWAILYTPESRLVVYDTLKSLMGAVGAGLVKDWPNCDQLCLTLWAGTDAMPIIPWASTDLSSEVT